MKKHQKQIAKTTQNNKRPQDTTCQTISTNNKTLKQYNARKPKKTSYENESQLRQDENKHSRTRQQTRAKTNTRRHEHESTTTTSKHDDKHVRTQQETHAKSTPNTSDDEHKQHAITTAKAREHDNTRKRTRKHAKTKTITRERIEETQTQPKTNNTRSRKRQRVPTKTIATNTGTRVNDNTLTRQQTQQQAIRKTHTREHRNKKTCNNEIRTTYSIYKCMSIVSCRLFWSYPKRFATFSDCCNVAIEDNDLNCENVKSLDSKAITTNDVIL